MFTLNDARKRLALREKQLRENHHLLKKATRMIKPKTIPTTKHTAGQWRVRTMNNDDLIIGTEGSDSKTTAKAVAIIPCQFPGDAYEREANAQLIACAPALLELLIGTLEDLEIRATTNDDGGKIVNISSHIYLGLVTLRNKTRGIIQP